MYHVGTALRCTACLATADDSGDELMHEEDEEEEEEEEEEEDEEEEEGQRRKGKKGKGQGAKAGAGGLEDGFMRLEDMNKFVDDAEARGGMTRVGGWGLECQVGEAWADSSGDQVWRTQVAPRCGRCVYACAFVCVCVPVHAYVCVSVHEYVCVPGPVFAVLCLSLFLLSV